MSRLEKILQQTEFSQDTDLKARLAKRLFSAGTSSKVVQGAFTRISDEDAELVAAAQGIYIDDPKKPEI